MLGGSDCSLVHVSFQKWWRSNQTWRLHTHCTQYMLNIWRYTGFYFYFIFLGGGEKKSTSDDLIRKLKYGKHEAFPSFQLSVFPINYLGPRFSPVDGLRMDTQTQTGLHQNFPLVWTLVALLLRPPPPPFIPLQLLDRKVMLVSMATPGSLTGRSIPHTNGERMLSKGSHNETNTHARMHAHAYAHTLVRHITETVD